MSSHLRPKRQHRWHHTPQTLPSTGMQFAALSQMSRGAMVASAMVCVLACSSQAQDTCPFHPRPYLPVPAPPEVDLLFVISRSPAMDEWKSNWTSQNRLPFAPIIDAIRDYSRPCSLSGQANCGLPDLRVAVLSSDLGDQGIGLPGCSTAGDGARLRQITCSTCPADGLPWLEVRHGVSNTAQHDVDQIAATVDAAVRSLEPGCVVQQPIEAMHQFLTGDTQAFRRPSASLIVIVVAPTPDCSTNDLQGILVDGSRVTDRCFAAGSECTRVHNVGWRCSPKSSPFLFSLSRYAASIGTADQVVIVGGSIEAQLDQSQAPPHMLPSCTSAAAMAWPTPRLWALPSLAAGGGYGPICSDDWSGRFDRLVPWIATSNSVHNGLCLFPPVSPTGQRLCSTSAESTCERDTLHELECSSVRVTYRDGRQVDIPRCPQALFYPSDWLSERGCGSSCPCWRAVHKPVRCPTADVHEYSAYGLDILGAELPALGVDFLPGTIVDTSCRTLPLGWSTSVSPDNVCAGASSSGQ